MAASEAANVRDTEAVRSEIASEREQLAEAVNQLRQSADLARQIESKLPLLLVVAFAVGFVLSGGIGATMRILFRRQREGKQRARIGRFLLLERN